MKDNQYLKFIFHEDLFLIEEPVGEGKVTNDDFVALSTDDQEPSLAKEPVSYFGKNEKGILLLIYDPGNSFLNQSDLDFLMRIVESGLRFSKNDIALVNTAHYPVEQVLEEIPHKYIISFGIVDARWEGRTIYQRFDNEQIVHLPAQSLTEIASDENNKRKLWEALKSIFNI